MKLFVGTSGFSYKKWKGYFYPEDLPDKEMLNYYSSQLPAVEINNTFYRLPNAKMLENWQEQVNNDFQFVLKATRKITHFKKLKDTAEETDYLFRTASTLGTQLGVILFQLPPYLRKDMDLLKAFIELIPESAATFEFRHRSWFADEVYEVLQARNHALCFADTDDNLISDLVSTADWGYVRMRRTNYEDKALKDWVKRIRLQPWDKVYAFFKHEDEGAGPKMAGRFLELAAQA